MPKKYRIQMVLYKITTNKFIFSSLCRPWHQKQVCRMWLSNYIDTVRCIYLSMLHMPASSAKVFILALHLGYIIISLSVSIVYQNLLTWFLMNGMYRSKFSSLPASEIESNTDLCFHSEECSICLYSFPFVKKTVKCKARLTILASFPSMRFKFITHIDLEAVV